jgi:hypothetical protein
MTEFTSICLTVGFILLIPIVFFIIDILGIETVNPIGYFMWAVLGLPWIVGLVLKFLIGMK